MTLALAPPAGLQRVRVEAAELRPGDRLVHANRIVIGHETHDDGRLDITLATPTGTTVVHWRAGTPVIIYSRRPRSGSPPTS